MTIRNPRSEQENIAEGVAEHQRSLDALAEVSDRVAQIPDYPAPRLPLSNMVRIIGTAEDLAHERRTQFHVVADSESEDRQVS